MSLLHLLYAHGYKRLVVCHFNHKLRGRHSDQDQQFVRRTAKRLNLKFFTDCSNVRELAIAQSLSVETAARQARYDFFQKTAAAIRCYDLILAHHADDQVETLLLNLFRGSGVRGLGAMRSIAQFGRLRVIRPLLNVWREEIDRYVERHRIHFREDVSNAQLHSSRNIIRHKMLPKIQRLLGRTVKGTLLRTATLMADEAEWLEELSAPFVRELGAKVRVSVLAPLPLAQQRWILQAWLRKQRVSEAGFDAVERVRALLQPDGPAKVNLPGGLHARRTSGCLWIENPGPANYSQAKQREDGVESAQPDAVYPAARRKPHA